MESGVPVVEREGRTQSLQKEVPESTQCARRGHLRLLSISAGLLRVNPYRPPGTP